MNEILASLSILQKPAILVFILKGVVFTLIISVIAVFLSIIFGSVLALVRNYCTSKKNIVFKWLASIYIEVFRNTPLLFWIFIGIIVIPVPSIFSHSMLGLSSVETKLLFKATIALTLFTSAVIAEIIRGGLNAVPKGQFEASYSQGFNTF